MLRALPCQGADAPHSLRYGPSGDTPRPATWGLVTTGMGLPVITDRLDTPCTLELSNIGLGLLNASASGWFRILWGAFLDEATRFLTLIVATEPAVLGTHQVAQLAAHQRPRAARMLQRHQAVPDLPLRRVLDQHERPGARPCQRQPEPSGALQNPQCRQTAAHLRTPAGVEEAELRAQPSGQTRACNSASPHIIVSTRSSAAGVLRQRLI